MGTVCSSNNAEAKTEKTNTNKNRVDYGASNLGKPVSGAQQIPAPNDGSQFSGYQNMDYQGGVNDVGNRHPGIPAYRTVPQPAMNQHTPIYHQDNVAAPGAAWGNLGKPVSGAQQIPAPNDSSQFSGYQNMDYQGRVNNVGNRHPGIPAYRTVPQPAMNQHTPIYQQDNVAAPGGAWGRGFQNNGFQKSAGMKNHPNPDTVTWSGYQNSGYQTGMHQSREIGGYDARHVLKPIDMRNPRFVSDLQNVRYQGNEMHIHGAAIQMNPVERAGPRFDSNISNKAGNYQAKNKQLVNTGPSNNQKRHYEVEPAAKTGAYQNSSLSNVGYKAMGSGMGMSATGAPCNCEVVDPPGQGGKGLGIKVYDPLVDSFVYEVENFPINGAVGSVTQRQDTNLTQPANLKQWTAVNQSGGQQNKYGVIHSSPRI